MLKRTVEQVGRYASFLRMVFKRPENIKLYWRQFILEADKLILSSIVIVAVISLFIGGVLVIQTASNLQNPFIDKMYVGYMVRESLILEFCSTMVALILAGKMGSSISSEIGSMRISEQIDAMDMMGVNSAAFLVQPKVIAATLLSPFLTLLSLVLGLVGGWAVVEFTGIIRPTSYFEGITYCFNGFYIFYSCFKSALFCFIISTVSAFEGYNVKGGSLGVGRSSTRAIVACSILILLFDLVVTEVMLY